MPFSGCRSFHRFSFFKSNLTACCAKCKIKIKKPVLNFRTGPSSLELRSSRLISTILLGFGCRRGLFVTSHSNSSSHFSLSLFFLKNLTKPPLVGYSTFQLITGAPLFYSAFTNSKNFFRELVVLILPLLRSEYVYKIRWRVCGETSSSAVASHESMQSNSG